MINEDLVWEFVKHDILLRKMSCLSVLSDLEPHSLFEKLDFGRYYYLLLYGSRMGLRQSFTAWRLAEFFLDNDQHYRNLYRGNKKKRTDQIDAGLKTVKRHLVKLFEAGLIKETGTQKETKGTGTIPRLCFDSSMLYCVTNDATLGIR